MAINGAGAINEGGELCPERVMGQQPTGHHVIGQFRSAQPTGTHHPTQFGLGDASGGDSAWRLYATLAGLPLGPQPELRWGAKLVIPELEMHAAFRVLREGHDRAPSLRERFRSWRGAGDLGLLDLRDPGPAIAVAARAIRRRLPPTS